MAGDFHVRDKMKPTGEQMVAEKEDDVLAVRR